MKNMLVDITGQRFGRFTVIERHSEKASNGNVQWVCRCDCGNTRVVLAYPLKNSLARSCGCLQKEIMSAVKTKHGFSNDPLYAVWVAIKERCFNEKHKAYADYGGRGITMCVRWKNSFEEFYKDVGDRPSAEYTFDRIKNDKGYEPGNCRWATRPEQARNRRSNIYFEHKDVSKTFTDWCKELNLDYGRAYYRLTKLGWSFEEVIQPIEFMDIAFDGVIKTLRDWCDFFDLKHNDIYIRILRGEKFEDIVKE